MPAVRLQRLFLAVWAMILYLLNPNLVAAEVHQEQAESQEELSLKLFIEHLRKNFDDIHDVSMRFHMDDPTISGLILLRMSWQDGKMLQGEVVQDETGSEEGQALLEAIGKWEIAAINGPVTIQVPIRIKLVGSDDPAFESSAILTGTVRDLSGEPLHRARISFESDGWSGGPVRPTSANREGVFVKTLLPPGDWTVSCGLEGYSTVSTTSQGIQAGEHRKLYFVLRQLED